MFDLQALSTVGLCEKFLFKSCHNTMQSNGGAAKLLEHDDIVISLVVDPVMGFQRRKLSSESFPAPTIHEKTILVNIVESIRKGEDVARALDELLSCEFTKTFTAHMDEAGLREHLKKYLIGFTDEGRVAEVGKLSASAKNAFNSFVGRVFVNSRQKTLFFAYYKNCNKKVVFT